MIDRIREDIEQRLEQLLAEADKLRDALSALGPGDGNGQATPDAARARPGAVAARARHGPDRRRARPPVLDAAGRPGGLRPPPRGAAAARRGRGHAPRRGPPGRQCSKR